MTKTTALNSCIDVTKHIITEALEAVGYRDGWFEGEDEDDKEAEMEFYLDDSVGLFFGDTISESIRNLDIEDLREDQPPFNALVNDDIISTYLAGGELALVVGVGPKYRSLVVGAVDRSTGIGALICENWVDPKEITTDLSHITTSKGSGDQPNPMVWKVQEIRPVALEEDTPRIARSEARLVNLLQDCRAHTLSKAAGVQIELTPPED
jgi:hypothetical protein